MLTRLIKQNQSRTYVQQLAGASNAQLMFLGMVRPAFSHPSATSGSINYANVRLFSSRNYSSTESDSDIDMDVDDTLSR